MVIRQLFDRESSTYTYLVADKIGGEAIIIDPVREQMPLYLQQIEELDLQLVFAVDTHIHADHVTALGRLRQSLSCASVMGHHSRAECVSLKISDGEELRVGNLSMQALYTPGHTDDSYSFLLPSEGNDALFTGDTLLIRGTGRTDFQNGDAGAQYDSLFDKLLRLPDDTLVYPAHDYRGVTLSSIGEEKRFNPRLQVASRAEYIELMDSLRLDNPRLMDVAVPANLSCGLAKVA